MMKFDLIRSVYPNEQDESTVKLILDNIDKILASLSPNEEKAIRLRYFDKLTYKEIGLKMHPLWNGKYSYISKNSAMRWVDKAVRKMRHPSRTKLWRKEEK